MKAVTTRILALGLALGASLAQAQTLAGVGKGPAAQCIACHPFEKGAAHGVGPNLFGVMGRPVAGVSGFVFSKALRRQGGTWTEAGMDRWLEDPQAYAPGTRMAYAGLKDPALRREVVEVLRKLK